MKHLASIFTFAFVLHLSAPAAEVVVYSPPSSQPLHVSVSSAPSPTNLPSASLTRTFPASYTGHRAVCDMPGASTNDAFFAWTGGDAYAPGDPCGTSAGREYPAVELTDESPVTPRIALTSGATDRAQTLDDLRGRIGFLTNHCYTVRPKVEDGEFVRVRVVRFAIDDVLYYQFFETRDPGHRVVFDKYVAWKDGVAITEADFLSPDSFDIDWEYFESEVMQNPNITIDGGLEVTRVDYMVVIGEGKYYWSNFKDATNETHTVCALDRIVTRRYSASRAKPTAVGPSGEVDSGPTNFRWTLPTDEYTAFRLDVFDGTSTNATPAYTTGVRRMPPRDAGVYVYSPAWAPASGQTYTWRVFAYNSKWRGDTSLDPDVGFGFYGSEPVTFSVK